ncbi:MAG: serine protein kinase RIO [Euryarchaeota archaeon]|nr:serine protein kinase RIO [Euryarchaeota archaeon]
MEEELRRLDAEIDRLRRRLRGAEELKVASYVLDRQTLLSLYRLANRGYIDVMRGCIKMGKESCVFLAESRSGERVAVKIHRIATAEFKAITKYITGDPRFKSFRRTRRGIVLTWVRKEFKNLETAHAAGVAVPKPLTFLNNVIVMELIEDAGAPAPMLRDAELESPESFFSALLQELRKLYADAKLVHADLSEYNVLVREQKPVLIDLSSAVPLEHPYAEEFLSRDVYNLTRYFSRYFPLEYEAVYRSIAGDDSGVSEDSQREGRGAHRQKGRGEAQD